MSGPVESDGALRAVRAGAAGGKADAICGIIG
jgi:hypothetical protein